MKRRDVLRSFALTPFIGRSALPSSDDSNAAPLYREAVARLPTLTDAERTSIADPAVTPLNGAAKSLVDRSAPALDLLRLAAKAPRCDWGDPWKVGGEGFNAISDFIGPTWSLVRFASLRARFAFRDRRPRDATDAVIAAIAFGRRFGQRSLLICQLVGFAVEHVAIGSTATALLGLDRGDLDALRERFDALPPDVALKAVAQAERAFFLVHVVSKEKAEYDDAKVKTWVAWYDRFALACDNPAELAAFRLASKGNEGESHLLDNFDAYRLQAIPYVKVKRAMLRAAIAVVEDGPTAVGRVLDPFDGKPFDLRTRPTGFELTSRFALEGKPKASLVVGPR